MSALALIEPAEHFSDQIAQYRREFQAAGDFPHGAAGLVDFESIADWLAAVRDNRSEQTVRGGRVPSSTFLAVRLADDRLVGMVDIRHRLNEHLALFGGHIGYSVRPGERRKGYAKEMLRLALGKCRELGLCRALLTCDSNNAASARTIAANGGVLESELPDGDTLKQRYWIALE